MVGLHKVVPDGAEEVKHSVSEKSLDDRPSWEVDYTNIEGSFLKTSLLSLPKMP